MSEHEPQSYEGIALTPSVAEKHLVDLYEGKEVFQTSEIVDDVRRYHESLGGIEGNQEPQRVLLKALTKLRKDSKAECRDQFYWKIFPDGEEQDEFVQAWNEVPREEEFGEGEEAVYLVYFNHHKRIAELNPTEFGTAVGKYPCKIGMTGNGNEYVKRIQDQFKLSWHSSITIGIVYRTERAKTVERYVHSQLDIRDREYLVPGEGGTEWFVTNTPEVFEIIKEVEELLIQNQHKVHQDELK